MLTRTLPLGLCFLFIACSSSTTGGAGASANATEPCDPLAPPPITLGTVLGAGKDANATLYVADERGFDQHVFVSKDGSLVRQHVAGSGEVSSAAGSEYNWSFQPAESDGSDVRSLLLQVQGGVAKAMAVAPESGKCLISTGCPGMTALTLVDPSTVAGMPIVNLPGEVQYLGDVENGNVLVLTAPMDGDGGTEAYRVFYGPASKAVEGTITSFSQVDSGGTTIGFTIDGTSYTMAISTVYPPDGGPWGEPGPGTLTVQGGASYGFTLRLPTPHTLAGIDFLCFAPSGG